MAKFEYKTHSNANAETIEAYDYQMDTKDGKLTFFDKENSQIASFHIREGAYVKRIGN